LEQLLNISTLFFVGALGAFCVAGIMTFVWFGDRSRDFVAHWAVAYALFGVAGMFMAFRGLVADALSINVAWALFLLAQAFSWLAFREFAGRRGRHDLAIVCVGPIVWLLFSMWPGPFANMNNRVVLQSSVIAAYSLSASWELWKLQRREPLPATLLFAMLYAIHGAVHLARMTWMLLLPPVVVSNSLVPYSPLVAFVMTESILIIVLTGMAQLALMAQRAERVYRIAAETDALTGLSSRRHFLETVVPEISAPDRRKGAFLLLDLDHFKIINDTHGHAAGDVVLVAFAGALAAVIRPPVRFARIGGEEFAIWLPEAGERQAMDFAEDIRRIVAGLAIPFGDVSLSLTVSCGVALATRHGVLYDHLHRDADAALYRAKAAGRDRVVLAPTEEQAAATGDLVAAAG
jgi:diguanylate cyclase (GGDEF)-like protein